MNYQLGTSFCITGLIGVETDVPEKNSGATGRRECTWIMSLIALCWLWCYWFISEKINYILLYEAANSMIVVKDRCFAFAGTCPAEEPSQICIALTYSVGKPREPCRAPGKGTLCECKVCGIRKSYYRLRGMSILNKMSTLYLVALFLSCLSVSCSRHNVECMDVGWTPPI